MFSHFRTITNLIFKMTNLNNFFNFDFFFSLSPCFWLIYVLFDVVLFRVFLNNRWKKCSGCFSLSVICANVIYDQLSFAKWWLLRRHNPHVSLDVEDPQGINAFVYNFRVSSSSTSRQVQLTTRGHIYQGGGGLTLGPLLTCP